ncbi:MAG: hypothetical protein OEW06_02715, partial [Gemmatimonadota bacterium]|nr:hypothetical protein [Gemmatimonadota bacterium]
PAEPDTSVLPLEELLRQLVQTGFATVPIGSEPAPYVFVSQGQTLVRETYPPLSIPSAPDSSR